MAQDKITSGTLISVALVAGFLAVVSLVLPWFVLLGKARSSVDLLGSASALDVLEGGVKVAVFVGWFIAPILVSAAMFLAASGRHTAAAVLLQPIGLLLLGVFLVGVVVDDIGIAWGSIFGAVFAALATVFAMMVLMTSRSSAKTQETPGANT